MCVHVLFVVDKQVRIRILASLLHIKDLPVALNSLSVLPTWPQPLPVYHGRLSSEYAGIYMPIWCLAGLQTLPLFNSYLVKALLSCIWPPPQPFRGVCVTEWGSARSALQQQNCLHHHHLHHLGIPACKHGTQDASSLSWGKRSWSSTYAKGKVALPKLCAVLYSQTPIFRWECENAHTEKTRLISSQTL